MDTIINQIKYFSQVAANTKMPVHWGTVSGYDPETYSVRVELQPEGVDTGWVPLLSPWIGNGWGMICPPSLGDMCEVQFQEGSVVSAFVGMRGYSNQNTPPQDDDVVAPGSFLLKNEAGTTLKFKIDGTLEIKTVSGANIVIDSDSEVQLGDSGEALNRFVMETFKALYNAHEHVAVDTPPSAPFLMTDAQLTTVTKGN